MNESESRDQQFAGLPRSAPLADSPAKHQLQAYLEDHVVTLLGTIRMYVQRLGLAQGDAVRATALDVLQEVAIEALAHEGRFTLGRQPQAWLLGIAVNVIRRKKAAQARRARRELPYQQAFPVFDECVRDDEGHGAPVAQATVGADVIVEAQEEVEALLALVSAEDQQVLRLAILDEFAGNELAARLGVTSGAARMRLHRALGRLRVAYRAHLETPSQKGEGRDA